MYSQKTTINETAEIKLNSLQKLILWVYKPKVKKENQLPTFKKITLKLLTVIILFSTALLTVSIIATGLSLQQMEKSLTQILSGNIKKSVASLQKSVELKEIGESAFSPLVPFANFIAPMGTAKIFNLYSFIDYSSTSLENLNQTYVMAENILLSLSDTETKINYADTSLALHSNLSQVYENLNQISLLSKEGKLPTFLEKKIKENSQFNNLKVLEDQIVQYLKVCDIIPAILSGETSKNILVLLQNSQIAKPSGGGIDYLLLLTLNQGKLLSKKYYLPQEIDSQYQSTASATKKLSKTTTPQPSLENTLQNPDFAQLSVDTSSYLAKTIKIKPDLIIATNDSLITQLLTEEKSATLEQFSLELVKTQGAVFYKDLLDQYLEKLFKNNLSLPLIGRTLAKQIGDNQILLWSADNNTQRLISSQSFSGVITAHPCNAGIAKADSCISDTTYISESQPAINRESPWASRLVIHAINITQSSIQHEYRLEYKAKNSPSSGTNINVLYHLYAPNSQLDQIVVNNLPSSTKLVEKTKVNTLDYYKIPITISTDIDSTVVIKFSTHLQPITSSSISYSLTELRQPGMIDPGINLSINYPEKYQPTVVTSSFTAEPSQIKLTLPPHTSVFGLTLDLVTQ